MINIWKSLSGQTVTWLLDRDKKENFPLREVTEKLNDYILTLAFKIIKTIIILAEKFYKTDSAGLEGAGQVLIVSQAQRELSVID